MGESDVILPNRPNRKITPDMVQKLLSAGCSAAECGRRLNVNSRTVNKIIKRYKLKRMEKWSRISAAHRAVILKMIENGLPITYVANQFNRSFRHIWSLVKEAGIPTVQGRASRERFPVSEREVESYLPTMVKLVRNKYLSVPVEIVQTAVHVGAAELRQHPRQANWLSFWRTIAERRLVDMVREECGRNGNKGKVLIGGRTRLVEEDIVDNHELPVDSSGLREEIARLPNDLRKLLSAVLRHGGPEEARRKLGMIDSTFYAKLREAYAILRVRLEIAS